MTERLRELLYRSLDTELTPPERAELERGLASHPELAVEREQALRMRSMLGRTAASSFPLGFEERVMERLGGSGRSRAVTPWFDAIRQMFRYVVAAAVPVMVVLVIWNLRVSTDAPSAAAESLWETPVETMLGNGQ